MLIGIAVVAAVVIAVVLVLAAFQPSTFRVERSTTVQAAPEKIFPLVNDLHAWARWSPWEALDPQMVKTFSGAASGTGAVYAWKGNSKAGEGRMEIVRSAPGKITIKLDFLKPFEAHNTCEFTFVPVTPEGQATEVTWAMYGPSLFARKIFHVFVKMDKLVGGEFERGLANLKAVAEGSTGTI